MIQSMTGYGKSQSSRGGYELSVEVKGVNHRYFDLHLRIPRRYMILEERIKQEVKNYIQRGRLEMTVEIIPVEESRRVIQLDKNLAIAYHDSLKELADYLHISSDIRLMDLFRLPDVYRLSEAEEDLEQLWSGLQLEVAEALRGMVEMRCREGRRLYEDIHQRWDYIMRQVDFLEQRAPEIGLAYEERLRARLEELCSRWPAAADEGRILQEVAIFADKTSVAEELVRLRSHLEQMEVLLQDGEGVGKKCDFLAQEMFREINTVASKTNDLAASQVVVEVKSALENIREQIQNIE